MKYFATKSAHYELEFLVVSTEDGRIIFYSTDAASEQLEVLAQGTHIPDSVVRAQIGGKAANLTARIKDFEILQLSSDNLNPQDFLIVTGSSDGTVRLWIVSPNDLVPSSLPNVNKVKSNGTDGNDAGSPIPQIGTLIGSYETANRITCLKAFIMQQSEAEEPETTSESGDSFEGFSEESNSDVGKEDEAED